MIAYVLLCGIALVLSGASAFGLIKFCVPPINEDKGNPELEKALLDMRGMLEKLESVKSALQPYTDAMPVFEEVHRLESELRGQHTKVSITSAELESVEKRLEELEEIRREVESSAVELREELRVLKEREDELLERKLALEKQLQETAERMQSLTSELKVSTEVQTQVDRMQTELEKTQAQCDKLLGQVQQANEHCMLMKQRYNALDIEYAQLYERFAQNESANKS
jgi:chromosome segregation ATPase